MKKSTYLAERTLIISGLLILISVGVIAISGDFSFWIFAKAFYIIGVISFLV